MHLSAILLNGLRDYGTAVWDGGDAGCDHARLRSMGATTLRSDGRKHVGVYDGEKATQLGAAYRDACGKCGAVRVDRQLGLEATPEEYIAAMVGVFREVRRVLRRDGTCWVNISGGYQNKQLDMMPARLALALQSDGWVLRSDIIWHKPGPMPESTRDRPTSAHEHVFLLSKQRKYYFDLEAIKEASGANCRNVWTIASYPFSEWTETFRRVRVARDAPCDGKKRITSPDCPVHGDQPDRVASVPDDAHAGDQLVHIEHSDVDPGLEPADDSAPTAMLHEPVIEPSTLDLLGRPHSLPAMRHSTQTHRTARAPATNQPCSVSAQIGDDIECTLASPSLFGSAERMPESSSALDGWADGRSSQTISHSAGMSRESSALFSASEPPHCTCEWYVEKTEKTSHFATFPPALAERCMRAGTSERGCCATCGAAWVREVQRGDLVPTRRHHDRRPYGVVFDEADGDVQGRNRARDGHRADMAYETTTTGWRASCKCEAVPIPCTILDPFIGSGTTALVADRLQRDCIGIDLNTDYTRMAMERCRADAPLFTSFPPAEPPEDERMRDLFAEAAE